MYKPCDFIEYEDFINKNYYDYSKFINNLNFLIDNENLKLDFLKIIQKLQIILPNNIFKYICDYMSCKDGCYSFYILFKALLNDELYMMYNQYIYPISNFTKSTHKYNDSQQFMLIFEYIYNIMNDDTLSDFMDIFDCNDNYEPLNIDNIDILESKRNIIISFINIPKLNHIQKFIHNYHRIKILYQLVYCFSEHTITNEENAKDDFIQRIIMNLDKYIILINYLEVIYYDDISKTIHFNSSNTKTDIIIHYNIPSNYFIKKHRVKSYIYDSNEGVHKYIDIPITELTFEEKLIGINELTWNFLISLDEIFVGKFKYYIERVLDYKNVYLNDKYHLNKYIQNGPFQIGEKLQNYFKDQLNYVRYIKYMNDLLERYQSYNLNPNCEFKLFLQNLCSQFLVEKELSKLKDYFYLV